MEKLELKPHTEESWMVHVYGRDRRLMCVLEPSHGWVFLIGCGFGLFLATLWVNLARYNPPAKPTEPIETSSAKLTESLETPYLQVD